MEVKRLNCSNKEMLGGLGANCWTKDKSAQNSGSNLVWPIHSRLFLSTGLQMFCFCCKNTIQYSVGIIIPFLGWRIRFVQQITLQRLWEFVPYLLVKSVA